MHVVLTVVTPQPWDSERHRAWQLFLSVSSRLPDRLDRDLQENHELGLIDFEILSRLSRAPDRRLRMSDLADQVLVSRSRLTYRIDRLADVGFVRREECEDDRRGMWAIVTDYGLSAHDRARRDHEGSVDTWFFTQMSRDELTTLNEVLARVVDKLSPPPGSTG